MEHAQARVLSSLALDEPLGRERERELAVHLVECADCKFFYEGLSRSRTTLRDARPPPPDVHAVERAVYRATTVLLGDADPGPLVRPVHTAETTGEVALPSEEPAPAGPGGTSAAPGGTSTALEELPPARLPRRERRAARRESRERRGSRGILFALTAGVVGLAVVAALLVTQPGPVRNLRSPLPDARELRAKVDAAFDRLTSLEASFSVTRLGLYRQEPRRILFAGATETGRLVYESPNRLREERTLEVPGGSKSKVTEVRTGAEVRTLVDGTLTVGTNLPLGPPDGTLRGRLGSLEQSLGSLARLLAGAGDLEVTGRTTHRGRRAYRVRFSAAPTELTRADRIEAIVDAETFLPLYSKRTIARDHASVLSPGTPLSADAIQRAFAGRARATTEVLTLDKLSVGDVILPGEFVVSERAAPQTRDEGWQQVSRAELGGRLPAPPLLPAQLPSGFRDAAFAVFTGARPAAPKTLKGGSAPEALSQASYSDGKTTIVVAQRSYRRRPELTGSPLQGDGLSVLTQRVLRAGRDLTFGVSPEVPPHVYWFVGDVLVVVSGYVSQDELLRVATSIGPA